MVRERGFTLDRHGVKFHYDLRALIPSNCRTDMPDVLNEAHKVGMRLGLFPIHEYWSDVGHPEDLEAADAYHKANGT